MKNMRITLGILVGQIICYAFAIEHVTAVTQENSAGAQAIEDMVVRIRTLAMEPERKNISVFVLTISCVLGWIVAKISLKLKHKSLITVLISLAVIGAYYFLYFKAQRLIQDLLANAAAYGERIKGAAYPVYLFGSVGVGNVRASVIVFVAVAALFGLMWLLLSHSFLQIATSTGKVFHREYREKHIRKRGIDATLLGREFSHFASSPNYMLNCGLGTFLMPLCAIAVLWKGSELFVRLDAMFAETAGSVPLLLCVVLCGFLCLAHGPDWSTAWN